MVTVWAKDCKVNTDAAMTTINLFISYFFNAVG